MKDYIKKNLQKIVLLIFTLTVPALSFADDKIINPINATNINDLIKTILQGVLKIGLPIITLAIVYCGFLFVVAQGNTEKLGEAKRALMYTLIGAAILMGSWAIAQLITNTVIGVVN